LFCQTFFKIFIICAKILTKLKGQLSIFKLQTFHDFDLKLKQSKDITLLHNIDRTLFIILHNHCFSNFSKTKKSGAKIEISNLNNYSTICSQNDKGITRNN